MKLVIDIDENIWEMVVNTDTFGCYRFNTSRAIRKGIPLDDVLDKICDEVLEYIDDLDIANEICKIFDKYESESEIHCDYTDEEITKSFVEDVEAVKDRLPRAESKE